MRQRQHIAAPKAAALYPSNTGGNTVHFSVKYVRCMSVSGYRRRSVAAKKTKKHQRMSFSFSSVPALGNLCMYLSVSMGVRAILHISMKLYSKADDDVIILGAAYWAYHSSTFISMLSMPFSFSTPGGIDVFRRQHALIAARSPSLAKNISGDAQ